jgi:hypothetical protein
MSDAFGRSSMACLALLSLLPGSLESAGFSRESTRSRIYRSLEAEPSSRVAQLRSWALVDRPCEEVWAVVSDLGGWQDWTDSLRVAPVDGRTLSEPLVLGFPFRIAADLPGPTPKARSEVIEIEPGSRLTWRGGNGAATGTHGLVLEAMSHERCVVTHWGELAGFGVPWMKRLRLVRSIQGAHDRFNRDLAARWVGPVPRALQVGAGPP